MKRTHIAKKTGIILLAFCMGAACPASYTFAAADKDTASSAPSKTSRLLNISTKTYENTFKTKKGLVYKTISFEYPVAAGSSNAAKTFNQFYKDLRSDWLKSAKNNLDEAKEVVKQLADNSNNNEDSRHYSDKVTCEITNNDENYISILQTGYEYTMGAHGLPYRISYIFNAKNGKEISAADILGITPEQLNTKIRKQYLKKFDKSQSSGNSEFYSNRDDVKKTLDKIDFNKNEYYLKNGKLHFYVYPYAVGPYAAGFIEVTKPL